MTGTSPRKPVLLIKMLWTQTFFYPKWLYSTITSVKSMTHGAPVVTKLCQIYRQQLPSKRLIIWKWIFANDLRWGLFIVTSLWSAQLDHHWDQYHFPGNHLAVACDRRPLLILGRHVREAYLGYTQCQCSRKHFRMNIYQTYLIKNFCTYLIKNFCIHINSFRPSDAYMRR